MGLASSYLSGEPAVLELYGNAPFDAQYLKTLIEARNTGFSSEAKVALQSQNTHPAQHASLSKLSQPGAVAVVTGQQCGLYLGPLFTIYKALSAVHSAQEIEKLYGVPAVPIFWLQAEDHDFDEIRQTTLINEDGVLQTLGLSERKYNRTPVNFLQLGPGITRCNKDLIRQLERFPHAVSVLDFVRNSYTVESSIVDAFKHLFTSLFSDLGLLTFNPFESANETVRKLYLRTYEEQDTLNELLIKRSKAIQALGFEPQIHIRANAPLFFIHPETLSGERYRIAQNQLVGTSRKVNDEEIKAALLARPHRVSSSALLRPLVQDSLFPTVSYIAGDAELNYFAQIEPLYRQLQIPFPLLLPRGHFRIERKWAREALAELDITPADLSLPNEALLAKVAAPADLEHADQVGSRLRAKIEAAISAEKELFYSQSKGLKKRFEKTKRNLLNNIERLAASLSRELSARDQSTTLKLRRLQSELAPHGKPQERGLGAIYYLALIGPDTMKQSILKAFKGLRQTEERILIE